MIHSQKVSVITIVDNSAHFLKTAFKSFAYQDYENMEWIIINNASTDKSANLLQKYRARDNRVRLCLNTSKKDYTEACCFAISKAEGDYIAFLEPENLWVKDKISRQVGFMKRYNAILSHTSYAFVDDRYNLLPTGCCRIEPSINLINFRKNCDICLSTFMMNHEEINKIFPMPENEKKSDLLMYLMQKGLVSQGMRDVMSLCRLDYSFPTRIGETKSVKKLYQEMCLKNQAIPSLMRYQAYRAKNVVSIQMDPSMYIGKDVSISLNEMKNFKL